jgi:phospholipid/cholesterol/gamma-HCH transport system ATP-binding protein
MNNNVIIFDKVSFGYSNDNIILQDLSFEIKVGQSVALIGGSGCGKTTILRLISGQLVPQYGKIIIFGQEINKISKLQLRQWRKRIGFLFQFGALFTDMSVYDNVAFMLKEHYNLPTSLVQTIVAMKLHAVGLFGTQNMMPQQLSGGMARRIALARAMALDPELMLYDEPFTGLDPIATNVSAILIAKLNKILQQTSVMSTHDIKTSFNIVDYIYFIGNKQIIAHGTPTQIQQSNNPLVAQFISGNDTGPYRFEYDSKLDYYNYLGMKDA